ARIGSSNGLPHVAFSSWNGPHVGTGLAASALNPARALAGNTPGRPPQQAHLPRRRPRAERQLRLVVLRSGLLQVRKDLGNNRRLLDAGDDLQLAATAGTSLQSRCRTRASGAAPSSLASLAMKSSGSITMCVVPSRYGVLSA